MTTYKIIIRQIDWYGGFMGFGLLAGEVKMTKTASSSKEILSWGYKIMAKSEIKSKNRNKPKKVYEVVIKHPTNPKGGWTLQINGGKIRAWPHVPFARGYLLKADGTLSGRGIE